MQRWVQQLVLYNDHTEFLPTNLPHLNNVQVFLVPRIA
jgi:hypothetical protein